MDLWQVVRDWATLLVLALTVAATIYGPTRVYNLQQASEKDREARRRQYALLHSLMRTRVQVLHQDHVAAINLIQLEYYGHENVQSAFRRYLEHLETIAPNDPGQRDRWLDDRQDRFYALIKEMADVLGLKFDKADLKRFAYSPQGWSNEEGVLKAARALVVEVLEGKRPIPVQQFHPSAINSKFPAPPDAQ